MYSNYAVFSNFPIYLLTAFFYASEKTGMYIWQWHISWTWLWCLDDLSMSLWPATAELPAVVVTIVEVVAAVVVTWVTAVARVAAVVVAATTVRVSVLFYKTDSRAIILSTWYLLLQSLPSQTVLVTSVNVINTVLLSDRGKLLLLFRAMTDCRVLTNFLKHKEIKSPHTT